MTALKFAARGAVSGLDARRREALFTREVAGDPDVPARVAGILARVRAEGDDALRAFAREFDRVELAALEVPRTECRAALDRLEPALRGALERAAANIRLVHEAFRPIARELTTPDGAVVGRRPDPLDRVGVYAPGGRAAYPSSLLMGAIPARVAGVREVIVCTPPAPDGRLSSIVLAAAALADADRVFAVGGAGAVAAMAYGTATIPRVDRIVGPGNAYVAEAKRQVARMVGIDSPAGPSELLIIADGEADATVLAGELLAQAEHDLDAAVMLLTDAPALADAVAGELSLRLAQEPRAAVIRAALERRGALLTVRTLDEAIAFANAWAPEHLLLAVREESRTGLLAAARGAGTVFVGESASVAFGDYLSGANHVLPTGGSGRACSGLSTLDFVRWTTWQRIDPAAAAALASDTALLATAEGLPAHAAAARRWENA